MHTDGGAPCCELIVTADERRRRHARRCRGQVTMLNVACSRCEWCGRLPVARLIEQHAVSVGEAVRLSSLYSDKLVWQAALAGPPSTDIRVPYSGLQPSCRETLAGLSRSFTMRRPPSMDKVALVQIRLLLLSGRSPEDRIAVPPCCMDPARITGTTK